jgi:HNH endonuclease
LENTVYKIAIMLCFYYNSCMTKSFDEIFCEIREHQPILLFQEEKFDRLGRRITYTKPGLLPIERFVTKILINDINGCWEWQGAQSTVGYGQFKAHNSVNIKSSPHRFIYEYFHGTIPQGKEIDHKCNNRICCNPKHLKAVTHKENVKKNRKKKCVRGHLMNDANIYTNPKGQRFCKKCRSILVNRHLKNRMENDSEFREKRMKYFRDYQRNIRDEK